MKLEPGAQVTANVKLLRPLGEGGMGAVWVAEHLALGTEVAVKFLQGNYAEDPAARARFSQEAAAASKVKSSHVVKIYDYGITKTNVPFIVMEMLEGTDLARRIEKELVLPPAEVVTIVTQLCKALERAHEQNVVHRDVKPENVFLAHEGGDVFVKLLDFGVAKTDTIKGLTTGARRSTLAGESLGTPFYMSPEQFKSAKSSDARSDLWSVGVLVYEALTGRLPFMADTIGALAIVVNEASPAPPSTIEPSLPKAFDAWFAKACARDPKDRFQSARELASALAAVFGAALTPGIESGSYRRVVISQIDPRELADAQHISMRDTSFATSGGSPAVPKRHGRTIAIGAAVVCAAVAVAFVTLQHSPAKTSAVTPSASPAATPSVGVVETHAEPAVAPPSASAPAIASAASVEASSAVQAIAARPTAKPRTTSSPAATAAPSASAKGPRHDRDIW